MLATRGVRAAPGLEPAERARPIALPWARSIAADAALVVVLAVSAFAIRYPYLWTAPRFRDETFNALRALDIYRGLYHALTDVELYMGSFFNYAVVAAFYVLGPTIYVPRLVVTLFGVATVAATYLLAREVGGRVVGVIAAAFLLTNGVHIAAMGHVGFSANIAPFFSTVGFWLLHRAVVKDRPWSLAGAGFFFGMGLHTHPIIVGFLPGAFLWFIWKGRSWLRTPWPYAAALLFLVAYSPMIAYNVQTAGGSVRHALYTATERPDYARGKDTSLTPQAYLERQEDYWMMSYRTLGGALDSRRGASDYLLDPALLATAALALVGIVRAARRGYSLPVWVIVPFSIILPIFNATHYDVEGDGRYFSPALPMIYACIGLLIVEGTGALQRRLRSPGAARAVTVAAVALSLILVLAPIPSLTRFYARSSRVEPTNASLIAEMEALVAHRRAGEDVLLDENLNDRRVEHASPWDEASTFRIFRFAMEFDAIPYRVVEVDEGALAAQALRGQPFIAIVSSGFTSKDTAELTRLIERFDLRDLDGRPGRAPRPADRHAIFRYSPP